MNLEVIREIVQEAYGVDIDQEGGQVRQSCISSAESILSVVAEHITSDKAASVFGAAWHNTPAGQPGARRKAGLQAVAALLTE